MANIQIDYSDIIDIFKEKLSVDNIVKKIKTIFLNIRYLSNIDYKPYFQRNYVWDDEKATYFIESIMLGTEIPPLVLFQTDDKNEVIDGRQRFETIERFLNDRLTLNKKGLHILTQLEGKKYSQLSEDLREKFEETRIRILQFKVVNEPKLEPERQDKIKKEIFRRYNSGITSLQKEEIERAAYIDDKITNYFYKKFDENDRLFDFMCNILLPKSKLKSPKRDKLNVLVNRVRTMLTLPNIPIYTYAMMSSKVELIHRVYSKKIEQKDCEVEFEKFMNIIRVLELFNNELKTQIVFLHNNKLFFETLYWGVSILIDSGIAFSNANVNKTIDIIISGNNNDRLWKNITGDIKSFENIFEQTGSHYYSAINNRYNYVANILECVTSIKFDQYLKNNEKHKDIIKSENVSEELEYYQLNKPLPETLTIEDILSDMEKSRFLIRPNYQRSEVKNIQKASYLMESILLGINLPPIFIYKRDDKIKEVVDGQQRLLTILGFLGKTYIDERGNTVNSNKDKFKLTKLKILEELNGKNIDSISEEFKNKILDFPIDVIEIDSKLNPEFSQIDLFLRLNSKPYPIKENTFEMWNAYVDKDIITAIRNIAKKYKGKIFKNKDTRMKVEELITSLSYLEYRMAQKNTEISNILNIYKKNNRICSRIMSKDNVTKTLSNVSNKSTSTFLGSIENVVKYIEKIEILINGNCDTLRKLFSHNRKGVQYKTDQNYYFLWTMLRKISIDKLVNNKDYYFDKISNLFNIIQKTPENYTISMFINDLEQFDIIDK